MLLVQRPCDDLENSLRLLGVHVEASQSKQARTSASSCQIAEGLTYSPHVEEAYEAIHNQHEEAQRGTGAHNDQGDQPLRQALISKAILHTRASFSYYLCILLSAYGYCATPDVCGTTSLLP